MGRPRKPDAQRGVTFDTVREIARELAGAVERTSYGTPAFFVGKTLFVREHQDGVSLVVRIEPEEREMLLRANPTTYSVTDHYLNWPLVLVRMATVEREELRELLVEAWRLAATNGQARERVKRTRKGGKRP
jgi:hypothetical protein